MLGGGGGDTPENNFEAVFAGLDRYEGIEKVVLICDNWALPRDVSLINQIQVPIDFVICGGEFGLNPAYLDLAHLNSGSKVITVEKNIEEMQNMKNGSSIVIGKFQYLFCRGDFKRLPIKVN